MLFEPFSKRLVHFLQLLKLLLADFISTVNEINIVLGNRLDLSLFVFRKVLYAELIDRITKDENFVTKFLILLKDRALKNGIL